MNQVQYYNYDCGYSVFLGAGEEEFGGGGAVKVWVYLRHLHSIHIGKAPWELPQ